MQVMPHPPRSPERAPASPSPRGPHQWRPRRFAALWAAAALVPLLAFLGSAWFAWQDVRAGARERLEQRAELLHAQTLRAFEAQEAILAAVEHRVRGMGWDAIAASADVLDFLRALDRSTTSSSYITLVRPDGRVALHSGLARPGETGLEAGDREWFRAAREAGPDGGTTVGEVVQGRIDGAHFFALSRALAGPDGGFGGVVAVSMEIESFAALYRTIAQTPGTSIVLARADGAVLVRHPPASEAWGAGSQPGLPVAAAFRAAADGRGMLDVVSRVDGTRRLVAFRGVGGYPVFVAYGLDIAALRAEWAQRLVAPGLGALAAAALLFWLTARTQRAARRETAALVHAAAEAEGHAEAEARLRQSEKIGALGQIAAGVAHDFNNLVQAVASASRLLERRAGEPAEVRRLTAMVAEAAERGGRIARRMLDFARRERGGGSEAFDLAASLRGVCELLTGTLGAGVRIDCVVPEGLPRAWGERAEFETVMVNLAVNARDAMPPGGGMIRIEVAPEMREDGAAEAADGAPQLAPGVWLRIAVADTGTGMPPEVLARAGEPFFTTKPHGKGTGLGLAMARQFAEQDGGALRLESTPGKGTVVTLWLRTADAPQAAAAPSPAPAARSGEPMRSRPVV
jgi:two-component system, NtrC family, sensor kinase